jgi:hypothetical protein
MMRYASNNYDYGYTDNTGTPMTVSIAVDGNTATFTLENAQDSYLYLARYLSASGVANWYPDQIYTRTSGDSSSAYLYAEMNGYSYNTAFAGAHQVTDNVSFAPQGGDSSYGSFLYSDNNTGLQTYLQASNLSFIELNPNGSVAVPEPASPGLFAAGLLAVATARRRKRS